MTKDDLIDRFGAFEIERLEKNVGDPKAIQKAISDASEFINGYVGMRYVLPMPILLTSVERAIAIVARYYLYKDKPTTTVRQDYEDVLMWLKDVSSGKVKLDFGGGVIDSDQSAFYRTGALVC